MNEFALIDRYFRHPIRDAAVRLGIGDDGAVVAPAPGCELVLSVDMLVEGRHFLPDVAPATLGHKTLAVNLSDMAAMGAKPRWALLAGALPDNDEAWIAEFARGLFALADRFDVALVGGDTTRGPRNLCLTIVGEVPAGTALARAGANVGDDIYVSGTLGDAALALAVLQGRAAPGSLSSSTVRERLESPEPRVGLGQRLRGVATSAIDISDGLTGDLGHILERSKVGATVDLASIPRSTSLAAQLRGGDRELGLACLLAGGDDYELCFTAPPSARDALAAIARDENVSLSRIGTVTAGAGLTVRDELGAALPALPKAFDHFA
ncbi:MAG TPA: thiamine-phosphate kinase [Casimicrobiaceae bacterium]|nr:thiamine-phosphate kinase [Casimicrobiaceae bacterium]